MNRKKILLCLPDCPFPVRRNGFSIRWAPIIEHFSKTYEIDMLLISPAEIRQEDLAECNKYSSNVYSYVRKNTPVGIVRKIFSRLRSFLPGEIPFDFIYYNQSDLNKFFCNHCTSKHYDTVVAVSKTFIDMIRQFASYDRLTIDIIDSSFVLKSREAKNWIDNVDAWLIRYWERKIIKLVDCASFISPIDRELSCGSRFDPRKVWVIPNGVYLNDSDNTSKVDFGAPTIGFLGNMSYGPNIVAAKRLFVLFKNFQKELPNLKLVIIGRDPVPEIAALSQDLSVIVTGTIENISPYINGIDLFVFGMQIGSGQQNKLLDAMAVKKPVITTQLGNSGVNAINGVSVVIANTDYEIERAVIDLMKSEEKRKYIGEEGYKFVMQTYSWTGILQKFENSLFLSE